MKRTLKRIGIGILVVFGVLSVAAYPLSHIERMVNDANDKRRPVIDIVTGEAVGPCKDELSCQDFMTASSEDLQIIGKALLDSSLAEGEFEIEVPLADTRTNEMPYDIYNFRVDNSLVTTGDRAKLSQEGFAAMNRLEETGWDWGSNRDGQRKITSKGPGVNISATILEGKGCSRNSQLNVHYYPNNNHPFPDMVKKLDNIPGFYYSISSYRTSC